jgi:DNA polymerase alpha subunit B
VYEYSTVCAVGFLSSVSCSLALALQCAFVSGPIQVVVAAGPFTQSDTLTYQPLEDLVEYIQEHSPHLVILIGPFIDATHPHVVEGILAETFQAFFEKIVDGIMEPLKM